MNAVTLPAAPADLSPDASIKPIDGMRAQLRHVDGKTSRPGRPAEPPIAPEAAMPQIGVGYGDLRSFEFTQRVARALATSTMVPEQYRVLVAKKRARDELVENPNAIPNCIIALGIASRLRVDVLVVMQNLHVVEGRPSWAATFVISMINSCGLFGRLHFQFEDRGEKEVEYVSYEWDGGRSVPVTHKVKIKDEACTAWAIDKETGERVEGTPVSLEMAVQEGWYGKRGSKWQTMPQQMLSYRAATFFGRLNAPNLLMGFRTEDEEHDIIDVVPTSSGEWVTDGGARTQEEQKQPQSAAVKSEADEAAPQTATHDSSGPSADPLDETAGDKSSAAATDATAIPLPEADASPPAQSAPEAAETGTRRVLSRAPHTQGTRAQMSMADVTFGNVE